MSPSTYGVTTDPAEAAVVAELFALGRVHLASKVNRPTEGGVLQLDVGGQPARIALLPWLSQRHVVSAADLLARDGAEHQQAYAAATRLIRVADEMTQELLSIVR